MDFQDGEFPISQPLKVPSFKKNGFTMVIPEEPRTPLQEKECTAGGGAKQDIVGNPNHVELPLETENQLELNFIPEPVVELNSSNPQSPPTTSESNTAHNSNQETELILSGLNQS